MTGFTSVRPPATPLPGSISRRGLLGGAAVVGTASLLSGCIGSGPATPPAQNGDGESGGGSGGPATLQISFSEPKTRDALLSTIKDYDGPAPTVNAVATEQFRAQLSTYLTSANPPDVIGWLAGSVARDYAGKGLLLDVSDLWTGDGVCANYSDSLRALCSDENGRQIFVPTSYYWWSIFYKKSAFAKWGITEPPKVWDDFIAMCDDLKGRGVHPLTNGIGSTPWMSSGWFDYLNLRVNGAQFHRDLLAGKFPFTDERVAAVLERYKQLIPYFDPNMRSYSVQEAVTPLVQDKAAMYLVGAFITVSTPKEMVDDIDFFSVPTIDPSVPTAEEAPTDGYMASAKAPNVEQAKSLMSFLASPDAQQKYIELSGSSNLPTSPDVDTSGFSPLVQKGIKLLNETEEITQFFNRDSSDALQLTADAALNKFLDDPSDIPGTLKDWQAAAERVFDQ
ncbi:MAG TPA: extracellular solute-binding protein [Microlunatus sp.]|nr:extracellular solute-binding protein [Microlunatus sp.]